MCGVFSMVVYVWFLCSRWRIRDPPTHLHHSFSYTLAPLRKKLEHKKYEIGVENENMGSKNRRKKSRDLKEREAPYLYGICTQQLVQLAV